MAQFLRKIDSYFKNSGKSIRSRYYNYTLKKKVSNLLKNLNGRELTPGEKIETDAFYKGYGIKNVNTSWHRYYAAANGKFYPDYVPENLFYLNLEQKLNKYEFAVPLSDKNVLDKLFPSIKQPEAIVKNINGFLYSQGKLIDGDKAVELCNQSCKMIIKPTVDTWGGNKIVLFSCENGITTYKDKTIGELIDDYKENYIIQKVVQQHPDMSRLNSSSLNTFRVMTYLKGKDATILSIVVRVGSPGSPTDNISSGGISCGVSDGGQMNEQGFLLSGKRIDETSEGVKFKDISFSFMDKINEAALKLHVNAPYFKLVSWDLAVDQLGEVVFIEYNIMGQGINLHQLNNGPVLSELLEELR